MMALAIQSTSESLDDCLFLCDFDAKIALFKTKSTKIISTFSDIQEMTNVPRNRCHQNTRILPRILLQATTEIHFFFEENTSSAFKPLSFVLSQVRNRFLATRVPSFTAMTTKATCSRNIFLAGSMLKYSEEF